jgi:aryl-alcohol dehydrogenase-like predicted oxidoreductase
MQKRKIGTSSLEVAPLAFGGNVFGWTVDEPTAFSLLDAFVDAGFNLIDTADIYARWVPGNQGGESETIIGRWLRQRGNGLRNRVVIATKGGSAMDPNSRKKDLSRPYLLGAVDDSLRRLGVDCIDLYQSHYDDPGTPVGETLETYDHLVKAGKIRYVGASNFTPARLAESLRTSRQHGFPAYVSLQPEYNLYNRAGFEAELQPLCLEHNLGVLNYYALASGFLTGKYRSAADLGQSPRGRTVQKYLDDRGFRILAALDEVAAQYRTTPAAIAVAWLLGRPAVTAPIASATSLPQLDALLAAARLTLDAPAVQRLDAASEWVTTPEG